MSTYNMTVKSIEPNEQGGVTVTSIKKDGTEKSYNVPSFHLEEGNAFGDALREYASKITESGAPIKAALTFTLKQVGDRKYNNLTAIGEPVANTGGSSSGKSYGSSSSGGYNDPKNIAGMKAGGIIKEVLNVLGAEASEDAMIQLGLKALRVQDALEDAILNGTTNVQQSDPVPTQTKTPPATIKKAVGGTTAGPGF